MERLKELVWRRDYFKTLLANPIDKEDWERNKENLEKVEEEIRTLYQKIKNNWKEDNLI